MELKLKPMGLNTGVAGGEREFPKAAGPMPGSAARWSFPLQGAKLEGLPVSA